MWKNFLFVNCLFIIFLTACSHTQYARQPIPMPGMMMPIAPPIPEENPMIAVNTYLKPRNNALIIIDPGHGGKDLGTVATKPQRYQEKFLNLTTAYMVKNYLVQMGYAVELTRTNDVFVSLDKRAEFANEKKPRLFVSIHYNSAPSKDAEGIEIFYYLSKKNPLRSSSSKKLANSILKRAINNTEAKSRGVKHGDLAVIRETNMPAVLVEGGFLTNANEVLKLKDASYLKKIAWGIAQGIEDYIEQSQDQLIADKK